MKNNFYIIAIGGSAGSLSAVTELLQYLPENLTASFITLQHIYETAAEYVQQTVIKATGMSVLIAANKMLIKPGCIYVLPGNKMMTIVKRHLYLRRRLDEESINQSIDFFLYSLAKSKQKTIGVILSGMGHDGAKGLYDVFSSGGISIAQTPESAQYPSMPQTAIKNNCVQFTLNIKQIADLIIEIAKPVR